MTRSRNSAPRASLLDRPPEMVKHQVLAALDENASIRADRDRSFAASSVGAEAAVTHDLRSRAPLIAGAPPSARNRPGGVAASRGPSGYRIRSHGET